MTTREIIEMEENNEEGILLLKEGIFWRAYNRSCMRMVEHVRDGKVKAKYVKKEGSTIFYCGFPESSFGTVEEEILQKGYEVERRSEAVAVIKGMELTEEDYSVWCSKYQPGSVDRESQVHHPSSEDVEEKEAQDPVAEYDGSVVKEIRRFPLENASPMDAILFVQRLKRLVDNGHIQ